MTTILLGYATFKHLSTLEERTIPLPKEVPTLATWEATIANAVESIHPNDDPEAWDLWDLVADEGGMA